MRRSVSGAKQREMQSLIDCSSLLSERAVMRETFEQFLRDCQLTRQSRPLTDEEKAHVDGGDRNACKN